jgi:hypothetical protein
MASVAVVAVVGRHHLTVLKTMLGGIAEVQLVVGRRLFLYFAIHFERGQSVTFPETKA